MILLAAGSTGARCRSTVSSVSRLSAGGGSALYGNYALGGVINIVTRKTQATGVQGQIGGGTRDTVDANLETMCVKGPLGLSLRGHVFSTGGYPIIQENQRGAVDIDADSRHQTFIGRLEYAPLSNVSLTLGGSYFNEDRDNGTPLQKNSTEAGYVGGQRESFRAVMAAIGRRPSTPSCRPSPAPSAGCQTIGTPKC